MNIYFVMAIILWCGFGLWAHWYLLFRVWKKNEISLEDALMWPISMVIGLIMVLPLITESRSGKIIVWKRK